LFRRIRRLIDSLEEQLESWQADGETRYSVGDVAVER
jgi:hypothetical protein